MRLSFFVGLTERFISPPYLKKIAKAENYELLSLTFHSVLSLLSSEDEYPNDLKYKG